MFEALAFLTVFPVARQGRHGGPPSPNSLLAFPLVGLLLGLLAAVVGWAAWWLWGPLVAAGAVTAVDLAATGGLHLDAMADVADGWACRRPPEEALAIMAEPSVGAVGAAVLAIAILLRWALLAVLISDAGRDGTWLTLVVAPVVGRATMVWVLTWSRQPGDVAGAPGSLADAFAGGGWQAPLGVAAVAALATGVAAGVRGLVGLALGALGAEAAAFLARRRFGRVPGDAIGAAGIATEILALAALTARR